MPGLLFTAQLGLAHLLATVTTTSVPGSGSAGNDLFGGTDLIRLLVLAFGGALVVGNVLALLRPPSRRAPGEEASPRPPLGRSVVMIGVGLIVVIWAAASLLS